MYKSFTETNDAKFYLIFYLFYYFQISPVTEADAGEYTCEVTNGEGDILRATMFLEVADA